MIANLPRQMLWTDLNSMEQFFELEPLNRDFHDVLVKFGHLFEAVADEVSLFNEVYYQLTRMLYEHPTSDVDLRQYVDDIYYDIGWHPIAEPVMAMLYHIQTLYAPNVRPLNKLFSMAISEQFADTPIWSAFNDCCTNLSMARRRMSYNFRPRPVAARKLEDKHINWKALTRNYDKDAIMEIINLWDSGEDCYLVTKMILTSKQKFIETQIKDLRVTSVQDRGKRHDEQANLEARISELNKKVSMLDNEKAKQRETVTMLEKDKAALQDKVSEQEAELARLRAQLAEKRDSDAVCKFTLEEIVEYGKSCVTWDEAKPIVDMLNAFLPHGGAKAEHALVNGIKTEFRRREQGISIANSSVTMQQPHIQGAMYEIKDNKDVRIGGTNNGE